MIGASASHCFSAIFVFERCFLVRKLYQEIGEYMLTSKIGKYQGSLGSLGEPIRLVVATIQTGLSNIIKLLNGLNHCVDLVETIEMHI